MNELFGSIEGMYTQSSETRRKLDSNVDEAVKGDTAKCIYAIDVIKECTGI